MRRVRSRMTRLLVALPLVAVPGVLEAQQPAPVPEAARQTEEERACVRPESEAIAIRTDPVTLRARLAEALSGRLTATLPEDSNARVVSIVRVEDEPDVVQLTLNTAEAVAGEWALAVRGEGDEPCTGSIVIRADAADPPAPREPPAPPEPTPAPAPPQPTPAPAPPEPTPAPAPPEP